MPIVSWMSERAWLVTFAVLVFVGAVAGWIALVTNHAAAKRRRARHPKQPSQ
jgi:hypothetical protein